ncbi:MAG: type III pantothenate kinase [Planctomycetaceae bacterium]|jgi:pantothenate kinase type III|nr:type III pantothenate kinase [Planctomycetaceae bacterium]
MIRLQFAENAPSETAHVIAVDAGNTNVKIAFPSRTAPEQKTGVLVFQPKIDPIAEVTEMLYREAWFTEQPVSWRIAATGDFPWQNLQAEIRQKRPDDRFEEINYRSVPLRVAADEPEKVGIDRILAGYGAVLRYHLPAMLVVDAGSAITADVISDGTFCGGAILPGLQAMAESYPRISPKLPRLTSFADMPDYPGKNTEDAIRCGFYGCITGILHQIFSHLAVEKDVYLILTGGDAATLCGWFERRPLIPLNRIRFEPLPLPLILEAIFRTP